MENDSKRTSVSGAITMALANAGYTLEGTEVELVLNPLRLAFETKNLKILEPALDCLHVCGYFFSYSISFILFSTSRFASREVQIHLEACYLYSKRTSLFSGISISL